MTLEEVEAWIEDGLNPAVVRYIAVEVLRESGLIPETKAELGEGSGVSSECLTDAAPVADGDARILFAHRHFGGSVQDAADLVMEPITLATYGHLIEYDALSRCPYRVANKRQGRGQGARGEVMARYV